MKTGHRKGKPNYRHGIPNKAIEFIIYKTFIYSFILPGRWMEMDEFEAIVSYIASLRPA